MSHAGPGLPQGPAPHQPSPPPRVAPLCLSPLWSRRDQYHVPRLSRRLLGTGEDLNRPCLDFASDQERLGMQLSRALVTEKLSGSHCPRGLVAATLASVGLGIMLPPGGNFQ